MAGAEGGGWGISTYVNAVFAFAGTKGVGVWHLVIGGALDKFYEAKTSASPVVKDCVPALLCTKIRCTYAHVSKPHNLNP